MNRTSISDLEKPSKKRQAAIASRTDLTAKAVRDIAGAMNAILADVFALYLKTKNFHWHMSGPHFRDYHLLLDEQAEVLFAMTDPIAERVRKLGGETLKSIGQISRNQRVIDNDAEYVEPSHMLAELADDNKTLTTHLREAHNVCDEHRDVATTSLIEVWIDETERRTWFLFEANSSKQLTTGEDVAWRCCLRGERLFTFRRLDQRRLRLYALQKSLFHYNKWAKML